MKPSLGRQPTVSVLICAYTLNRWNDLVAAVKSAQAQAPHEVIVVADHNDALLSRLRAAFPGVRAIANDGPQGLSGARNAGVAAASGDVIAFLDDDAVAVDGWLDRLSKCFADPHVHGAGGAVDAAWTGLRPRWFPEEFEWVVGCSYRGLPTAPAPVRNPIGANMAVRRDVFAEVGGFAPNMGRAGANTMGCEETDFFIRARAHLPAAVWLYEPRARVRHRVSRERATLRYFLDRCYSEGKSKALLAGRVGRSDALSAERRYVLRVLPRGVLVGIRDAGRQGDRFGLARAGTILAGLAATAAGYGHGRLRRGERKAGVVFAARARPRRASDRARDTNGRGRSSSPSSLLNRPKK
jgi:glycosyltransferase involved in cell wall biosynthesis